MPLDELTPCAHVAPEAGCAYCAAHPEHYTARTTRLVLDFDLRELSMMLAALRAWQVAPAKRVALIEIAENAGPMLSYNEINRLCERINSAPALH